MILKYQIFIFVIKSSILKVVVCLNTYLCIYMESNNYCFYLYFYNEDAVFFSS